ncbi:nucleotide exchange factor GrpE [Candidatus Saccharibacteria bacterium]|nr:MAG: nucleotide exchange factor GrpE [Candidatus Saccharibacteria bacterium]
MPKDKTVHHKKDRTSTSDQPKTDAKGKAAVDYHQVAEQLAAENAHIQQQVAELTEALQRERADAVNLRRRNDEQVASLHSTVKAGIIKDLLPVIDNFERALQHIPAELADNDFVKGVEGIVKQFAKTLADLGVERIKTVGEPFDPHVHEAVSMEEGDGKQEIVCEELQSGYCMGSEVIRHAMVRVKS